MGDHDEAGHAPEEDGMRPLPGTDMQCYLRERLRDERIRALLHGMVWTGVTLAVLGVVLAGGK